MEKQNRARSLYLNEGKTQKEIAEIVGVSERTIYNWIKQFAWDKLRQAAFHAPAIIADNLYSQIVELQNAIAEREPGKRFPTLQEAEITRKLMCCLDKVKGSTSLAQNAQMIASFRHFTYTKSEKAAYTIQRWGEEYLDASARHGYKPYEMAYYPYPLSPFSFFDNEEPIEEQQTYPVQDNPTPEKLDISHNSFDLTLFKPALSSHEGTSRSDERGEGRGEVPTPDTTFNVHRNGTITEAFSTPEKQETENISEAEKPASEEIQTIDYQENTLQTPPETDQQKPEISGNDNDNIERINSKVMVSSHEGTSHRDEPRPCDDGPVAPEQIPFGSSTNPPDDNAPVAMSAAYFSTLPPHRRPSPFREGNIIWINHVKDITEDIAKNLKMGDIIRCYPDMGTDKKDKRA